MIAPRQYDRLGNLSCSELIGVALVAVGEIQGVHSDGISGPKWTAGEEVVWSESLRVYNIFQKDNFKRWWHVNESGAFEQDNGMLWHINKSRGFQRKNNCAGVRPRLVGGHVRKWNPAVLVANGKDAHHTMLQSKLSTSTIVVFEKGAPLLHPVITP